MLNSNRSRLKSARSGSTTTYNGQAVFGSGTLTIFMSDSSTKGTSSITVGMVGVKPDLSDTGREQPDDHGNAQTALTNINTAIAAVAALRGNLGASSNQLQAASNVMNNQITNVQSAESGIMDADIGETTANLSRVHHPATDWNRCPPAVKSDAAGCFEAAPVVWWKGGTTRSHLSNFLFLTSKRLIISQNTRYFNPWDLLLVST